MDKLEVGSQSRDDVLRLLGSPPRSEISATGRGTTSRNVGSDRVLEPKIVDRNHGDFLR
jgi:hypothetical protein